jgi:hypothetical protein
MVLLTITSTAKHALEEHIRQDGEAMEDLDLRKRLENFGKADTGNSIEHSDLIRISKYFRYRQRSNGKVTARESRLDALLRAATVYQSPPPPRPEPVSRNPQDHRTYMLIR